MYVAMWIGASRSVAISFVGSDKSFADDIGSAAAMEFLVSAESALQVSAAVDHPPAAAGRAGRMLVPAVRVKQAMALARKGIHPGSS